MSQPPGETSRTSRLMLAGLVPRFHTNAGTLTVAPGRTWTTLIGGMTPASRTTLLLMVEMTVIGQREDLIAWYERRGYRRTGIRSPFPYGEERFGVPRQPDLYFETLTKSVGP